MNGSALLMALIMCAVLGIVVQTDLQTVISSGRIAALDKQRLNLERAAQHFLIEVEERQYSAEPETGCSGSHCYDEYCSGGKCFSGEIDASGQCRLLPAVPAVWQNPDIWEKRSWREAGGNEQHRLRGLTELLCFLPAEDASKRLPLFRTTVQLHHAGGQMMIQSVHSQLGRHRWRML